MARPIGTTGIKKKKLKPPGLKQSVKRRYNFTPSDYQVITDAIAFLEQKEARFVREAVLLAARRALKHKKRQGKDERLTSSDLASGSRQNPGVPF
jgi:hypothetical protein